MLEQHPTISVVVPVHNEENILVDQVRAILDSLHSTGYPFEFLLVENGSTDQTALLCHGLAERMAEVRVIALPTGNYGLALKEGILNSRHDIVVVFNIEFWSIEFVRIAMAALQSRSLVIGSKSAPGAQDTRPFIRRLVTRSYNQILRWIWGFDGTDTHGMKAFWREHLLPIVSQCVTGGFVFDTELVLLAQRSGLSKLELPTNAEEQRAPTYRSLARRVPHVLSNLWLLWRHLPPRPRFLNLGISVPEMSKEL
jgi:glycosyltransferase involved in cell wall biosynthesis